jgi:hypothetical protein
MKGTLNLCLDVTSPANRSIHPGNREHLRDG